MSTLGRMLEQYVKEIKSHRDWLQSFDDVYTTQWEKLLKRNPEAAICEAATRQLLQKHGLEVEPNEDPSVGGPDYLCRRGDNQFYVEVTCISKNAATKATGLIDDPLRASWDYEDMTKKIFGEICSKTPQCSNLDAPCIIAIGTLHSVAGCCCFDKLAAGELLTGTSFITATINTETRELTRQPYEATNLESAAFVRPTKTLTGSIEYARNPISAVLLCAFGCDPSKAVGALHPNPNHYFDRTLLPSIEFGRLSEGCLQTGQFKVEWV